MCLWYVQVCPECDTFTPMPGQVPIECNNSACLRRPLNPHTLTEAQHNDFLTSDDRCSFRCDKNYCGLLCRIIYCGFIDSLRNQCAKNTEDSASDSESEDEGWIHNYRFSQRIEA